MSAHGQRVIPADVERVCVGIVSLRYCPEKLVELSYMKTGPHKPK